MSEQTTIGAETASADFGAESKNFGLESNEVHLTEKQSQGRLSRIRARLSREGRWFAASLRSARILLPSRESLPALGVVVLIVGLLITLQVILVHEMVPRVATVDLQLLTHRIAVLPSLQTDSQEQLRINMRRASEALQLSLSEVAKDKNLVLIQKQAVVSAAQSGVPDETVLVAKKMLEHLSASVERG